MLEGNGQVERLAKQPCGNRIGDGWFWPMGWITLEVRIAKYNGIGFKKTLYLDSGS